MSSGSFTSRSASISRAAAIYVRLDQKAEAVELLERLYERRYEQLATVVQRQEFTPLRDYPPFLRLLEKLNLR